MVARQVAKRYAERGVISLSVDPGVCSGPLHTLGIGIELQGHVPSFTRKPMVCLMINFGVRSIDRRYFDPII